MHIDNMIKEDLKRLLKKKKKIEISKEYNMSIEKLNGLMRRLRLTPLSMYEEDELRDMLIRLLGFHTVQDVANMFNVNSRTIYYYLQKCDIDIRNDFKVKRVGEYYYLFLKRKLIGRIHKDCLKDCLEET